MPSLSAISTSMMLGGIRMPSVPTAHTVPTPSVLAYWFFSMTGRPSRASSTTEAPMMPVDAASSTPIRVTVTARPPRMRPNNWTKFSISRSAMPDRSSISPMKMNMGRATSSSFSIDWSQIWRTIAEARPQLRSIQVSGKAV